MQVLQNNAGASADHLHAFQPMTKKHQLNANSTGSLALDIALGAKGFAYNQMIEIAGDTASGKTTLALHCVMACQQNGGTAAFLDSEFALDPLYATKIGVNVNDLIFTQPKTAEQAFDIAFALIQSVDVNVIVIDSLAALLPERQLELPMNHNSALQYHQAIAEGFCKLRSILALKKKNCTVIFTNQLRMNNTDEGAFSPARSSIRMMENFMATRIKLAKGHDISNDQGIVFGNHCDMEVIKHHGQYPKYIASTPLIYQSGMASSYETLKTGLKTGVVSKDTNGFFALGSKLGKDGKQAKLYLDKSPFLRLQINKEILHHIGHSET